MNITQAPPEKEYVTLSDLLKILPYTIEMLRLKARTGELGPALRLSPRGKYIFRRADALARLSPTPAGGVSHA